LALQTINKLKQYNGYSASELLYGITSKPPGDFREFEDFDSEEEFLKYREEIRQDSTKKRNFEKDRQEENYNKTRKLESYENGEEVMVYFEPNAKFNMPVKFQEKFREATVLKKLSDVTYLVRVEDNPAGREVRQAHVAYMKKKKQRRNI